MKRIFFHSPYKYLFSLIFAFLGIFMYLINNDKNLERPILSIGNACFIVGFVLVLVGGLSILSNLGAFDIFSYQFKRKGTGPNKYTLYDHQQKRIEQSKTKKFNFIPYITVGGFFLIISFIFTIIYSANI